MKYSLLYLCLMVVLCAMKPVTNGGFAVLAPLPDLHLALIRGGFLTSSGMMIDIGLVTKTLVDGVLLEETRLNITPGEALNSAALQTLVQVQENHAAVAKLGSDNAAQLLTIIQNTRNDVVVDNLAILNVDVDNAALFSQQARAPLLNYQLVQGLR